MRQVNVYVDQSSCIELHGRETVRIDRLQPTAADGYVAERHGALTRLARAAGIQEQRCLAGTQATCAAVAETIARGVTALAHNGLLVVTFSGHTEWKHDQTFWCLHDGELELGEIAACLAGAAASAPIVVVADTCYAQPCGAMRIWRRPSSSSRRVARTRTR